MIRRLAFCVLGIFLFSCTPGEDESKDDSGGGGASGLSLFFRGSNLASTASSSSLTPSNTLTSPVACNDFFVMGSKVTDSGQCGGAPSCYPSAGAVSGSCMTPISVTGRASIVLLSGNYFGGGVRLLGGARSASLGQEQRMEDEEFDMANAAAMSGENNTSEDGLDNENTNLNISFNSLDLKVAVPRSGTSTEYWTIRYIFVSLPFTQETRYSCVADNTTGGETCTATSETIGQCMEADDSGSSTRADTNNANLFGGLTGVKAGDILFCRKTSLEATCASTDWEWLDTSSDSFVTTRPSTESNVHKFARYASKHYPICEDQGNPSKTISIGGFMVSAKLYENVRFAGTNTNGFVVYSFQSGSGEVTKGSEMELFIDIDLRNSVFTYDSTTDMSDEGFGASFDNYRNATDAQLAKRIWFKPFFFHENSQCDLPGDCDSHPTGIKAKVQVALSGATEPPVYDCEDDKGNSSSDCVANEATGSQ